MRWAAGHQHSRCCRSRISSLCLWFMRRRLMPESTLRPVVINFYETTGLYGCFSNFSRHPIVLGGKTWPTSEHYFQAQKYAGTGHEEEVRNAPTAMIAARMGRSRQRPLREDWDNVKDQIMLQAVRTKFTQHEDLKAVLAGTGDATL